MVTACAWVAVVVFFMFSFAAEAAEVEGTVDSMPSCLHVLP